jgi:tellurite resistance-related uncharacterized protein
MCFFVLSKLKANVIEMHHVEVGLWVRLQLWEGKVMRLRLMGSHSHPLYLYN